MKCTANTQILRLFSKLAEERDNQTTFSQNDENLLATMLVPDVAVS